MFGGLLPSRIATGLLRPSMGHPVSCQEAALSPCSSCPSLHSPLRYSKGSLLFLVLKERHCPPVASLHSTSTSILYEIPRVSCLKVLSISSWSLNDESPKPTQGNRKHPPYRYPTLTETSPSSLSAEALSDHFKTSFHSSAEKQSEASYCVCPPYYGAESLHHLAPACFSKHVLYSSMPFSHAALIKVFKILLVLSCLRIFFFFFICSCLECSPHGELEYLPPSYC